MNKQSIIVIFVMLITNDCFAKGDHFYQLGGYFSLSSVSVDDPDGKVKHKTGLNRIGAHTQMKLNRKTFVNTNLYFFSQAFEGSANEIGQNVKGYGLSVQYYHRTAWYRHFQPYLGAGLALNSYAYKDRFTVTTDGFLASAYDNRKVEETVLQLTSMLHQDWTTGKTLVYRLTYERPLDTGIEGLFLDVGILFD